MTLHQPSAWLLLALLLLPVLWWRARRTEASLPFSNIMPLSKVAPSMWERFRWIVPATRFIAVSLLIVALARPQLADERTPIRTQGIAIQLLIDRSGSMQAMDFEADSQRVDRLSAVKVVVEEFVVGGDELPGRPHDLIGVIAFATYADSICPLTLDHAHLIDTVRQIEVPSDESNRATAIGDAIALGVERIRGLERRTDIRDAQGIKSRVMILLTDGENNAGDIDPITAARMAEAFDIRVYTIGAGTERAYAPIPTTDPFSGRTVMRNVRVSIDEDTLKEIAQITGGQYFRATDSSSLEEIYANIDELERTEIEQQRYYDYRELAVQPIPLNGVDLPPLLAVVLVLIGIEVLLRTTRFLTIP